MFLGFDPIYRNIMVPAASLGSGAAWIVFAIGLVFRSFGLVAESVHRSHRL